jgi:hypothetical protein
VRRSGDTTVTGVGKRKSSFLPFLLAVLMAGALLALIGWQAAPWLMQKPEQGTAEQAKNAPQNAAPQNAAPSPPAAAAQPGNPEDLKPSPLGSPPAEQLPPGAAAKPAETVPEQRPAAEPPAEQTPSAELPVTKAAKAPAARPPAAAERPVTKAAKTAALPTVFPVVVISSPGGATATLDGRPDNACRTPCSLNAAPGSHTVAITMPGYQVEHRDVLIGSGPVDVGAVVLRALGGTLMLSSVPPGATVLVNGKRIPQTTPAMIPLAPGSYKITVEKDGQQSSATVDIRNNEMRTLRILLEQ